MQLGVGRVMQNPKHGLDPLLCCPERSFVDISKHAVFIVGVSRVNYLLVLYVGLNLIARYTERNAYRYVEPDLVSEHFHFFQGKLYRRVIGLIVLPMPKQRA